MIKLITQTHNRRNTYGYAESFTIIYNAGGNRMPICVLDDYSYNNIRGLLAKVFRSYEEFMTFEYDHNTKKSYAEMKRIMHPTLLSELMIYNMLASHKIITEKRAKELANIHYIISERIAHLAL